MPLNLRQLEILRAVLASGTVTEAARRLHISQPAVSKMLRQAEDHVGFKLFKRDRGRLYPTAEARTLFPEVNKVFTGIESVQRLAEDLRDTHSGLVTIAATPALADSFLPLAIERFRAARPRMHFAIHTVVNYEVVATVADHRADLGLVLSPVEDTATEMEDLCTAELVCVMPQGHPLTARKAIRPVDMQRYPLVSFSRNLPIGAIIEEGFKEQGQRRTIAIEVTQSSTACALVRAGAGIAVVDSFALLGNRERDLVIRPLRPAMEIVARLLRARHRPLSRLATTFVQELRRSVEVEAAKGRLRLRAGSIEA